MYDITGEIAPRGRNFMSRDDMSELEEDDESDDEGPALNKPPAKGGAKRDLATAGSSQKPNSQVNFHELSSFGRVYIGNEYHCSLFYRIKHLC